PDHPSVRVPAYTSSVVGAGTQRVGAGSPRQVVQPAEQPEGVDLQMAGGRTRLDASNADESSPQKAMPQAPVSGAGQAPAGAAPEAEESEGYGYSYDDDPLSAGGFDETERLQPESDSVEPDSAELMVEESSAAQDYEVE